MVFRKEVVAWVSGKLVGPLSVKQSPLIGRCYAPLALAFTKKVNVVTLLQNRSGGKRLGAFCLQEYDHI